jgi:2-C-methyl-D-erythritol 4-phosphate cytidylyltransferase
LVLLAGGVGERMGASIPKQYLQLLGHPIATYSLRTFAAMPEVGELIVVCAPQWRGLFEAYHAALPRRPPLVFAAPGQEWHDSAVSGLRAARPGAAVVALHDAARPLVTAREAAACFVDALAVGKAILGVPIRGFVMRVDACGRCVATIRREELRGRQTSLLWETQTPQAFRLDLLSRALAGAAALTEAAWHTAVEALPTQVTVGQCNNIKVTTPEDLVLAERLLQERKERHGASPALEAKL